MKHAGQGDLSGFTEYECLNPTTPFRGAGRRHVRRGAEVLPEPIRLRTQRPRGLSVHHPSALIYGVPVSSVCAMRCRALDLRRASLAIRPTALRRTSRGRPRLARRARRDRRVHAGPVPGATGRSLFPAPSPTGDRSSHRRVSSCRQGRRQPGRFTSPPRECVHRAMTVSSSAAGRTRRPIRRHTRCFSSISGARFRRQPFVQSGDNVFQGAVTGDVRSCLRNWIKGTSGQSGY